MHPAQMAALVSCTASSAMAAYVGTRRHKTGFHWLLLSVLTALILWTGGIALRWSVTTPAGLAAALQLVYAGVLATPPLWLLLALRYAGEERLVRRWAPVLLFPSWLTYLALVTNEGHELFVRRVGFEEMAAGPRLWGGPLFWTFLAWAYVCVLAATLVYAASARRMAGGPDRNRGALLACAAAVPLASSLVYVLRLAPVPFDLTPTGLVFTLVVLSVVVFRHRLLESRPLTRRDVIEYLHDGVVMATPAGTILDTNPAANRMLGTHERELHGRPLAEIARGFASDPRAPRLRESLAALSAGHPAESAELANREGRCIEVTARLHRREGAVAGQFAVLRDRTEERRIEQALRRNQRLESVGTLASGIAHEINNPLAFIRANLSQIYAMGERVEETRESGRDKLAEDLAELREITAETLDGIGRIEKIVSGMRRLTTAGNDPFVPVDVNDIVRDAVRLANLRNHPRFPVTLRLAERLPRVAGSPDRLGQAILNLLVNARQALEPRGSGRIGVATRREGATLCIEVRDDGPGIPDAVRDRIFDPFFTTKDPDQGTGLGLPIAFDILRDHGGTLEVDSRSGAGACFVARIPIRR
jgi:PAS domain S-box-containing protein